jgi:hypothetical protein
VNSYESDIVEKTYSNIENGFAQFLNYLLKNHNDIEIMDNEDTIYMLKCYIALQFWRLSVHDFFIDDFINNFDFRNAPNRIISNIGNKNLFENKEIIEKLNQDKNYRYYFRCFILPFLLFNTFEHKHDIGKWRIYTIKENTQFAYLCSDIPIIYNTIFDLFNFKSKILFPITKNKILIITDKEFPNYYQPIFSANVNIVLYEQSTRYLSTLKKDYLNEIIKL